jgi:hypothetical protein
MKRLIEYIEEKTYELRIKFAMPLTSEQVSHLEKVLERYEVVSFKQPKKTPIQSNPMHFEGIKNAEVYIVDCEVKYPAAPHIVREVVVQEMRIPHSYVYVMTPYDPLDVPEEPKEGESKLEDSEYKDSPKVDHDQFYGTNYNKKLVSDYIKQRGTLDYVKNAPTDSKPAEYDETNSMSPLGNKK